MKEENQIRLMEALAGSGVKIDQLIMDNHGTMTITHGVVAQEQEKKKVTPEQVATALAFCKAYIWGSAAYTVPFCVVRDDYDGYDNASSFERLLVGQGIEIADGTLNSAFSRNPWMRLDVDKWEENGAPERALRLRNQFRQQMALATISEK